MKRRFPLLISIFCLWGMLGTSVWAQQADLGITMSDNQSTTTAGSSITYLITVINNGPDTAANLTVVDYLPAVVTNPVYTPSKGTFNPQTGLWSGANLANGESIFLEIRGTVSASASAGTILNTAYVLPANGMTDPTQGNNTCSDKTDIPGGTASADLGVVKSDNRTTIAPGESGTYLITVINNGPATLSSFTMVDKLPPGITATKYEASEGTYNAATGEWTGITFEAGESLFLAISYTVSVSVTSGTQLLNTATVYTPAGTTDPNPTNNICHDATTVQGSAPPPSGTADLGITKSDNRETVAPGDASSYVLTIINNGPDTVTSLTVIDTPPAAFVGPYTYTTRNSNGQTNIGTYNPQTGLWSGIRLAVGESLFLEIRGTVSASAAQGVMINTATVGVPSGYTDPKSDNNACEDKTNIVTVGGADLVVQKSVSNATPAEGDEVEWTVSVTNNGPSVATAIAVTDKLPVGLTYVSTVSASQGSFNPTTGVWTVGDLNAGLTATLKIKTSVNNGAPTEIQNCAKGSMNTADPNVNNNTGCATVSPKGVSCSCDAGVESGGEFALALAQRTFNRQFVQQSSVQGGLNKTNAPSASILSELVPNRGPNEALPFDQTWAVNDLITYGITKAENLYAVDYKIPSQNNRRMAGIFSAITKGQHYEHSKVTCDRFGTHTLDDVSMLNIAGNPFILSKIVRADGQLDYAVTFTARQIGNTWLVDSRNSTVEYSLPASPDEQVLTFEVWTLSPDKTANMVQEILRKLQSKGAVTINNTEWNAPAVPPVYVRSGRYAQNKLTLDLANPNGLRTARLEGFMRRSEKATQSEPISITLNLTGSARQQVEIPTNGPIYDVTLELTDGSRRGIDQLYYADGTWSYNAPANVQNIQFSATSEPSYTPETDTYLVERDAHFGGTLASALESGQVVSLFRTLKAGGAAADFSAYNAIQFTAAGQGRLEIVPETDGIAGSNQFRTVIDLTSYPKTYTIRYTSFSNGTTDVLTGRDLRWLSFYILPNAAKGYPQTFDVDLKDVKFLANTDPLPTNFVLYPNYPNPFNPGTTIQFNIPQASDVKVAIYDVLGREVQVLANGNFRPGLHSVQFDGSSFPSGVYFYRLYIGKNVLTGKMVLNK